MRAVVFGLWLSTTLLWVPAALWVLGSPGHAAGWWAGVITVYAGRVSAEVIHRGGNHE